MLNAFSRGFSCERVFGGPTIEFGTLLDNAENGRQGMERNSRIIESNLKLVEMNNICVDAQICLYAIGEDPWALFHAEFPVKFLEFNLDVCSEFLQDSDAIRIYYSKNLTMAPFSESQCISVPISSNCTKLIVQLPLGSFDLRIDVTERKGSLPLSYLRVNAYSSEDEMFDAVVGNQVSNGVLLVTHELSKTGAPILALNLAKAIAHSEHIITTYIFDRGGEDLRKLYEAAGIALLPFRIGEKIIASKADTGLHFSLSLLKAMLRKGYKTAILNTVNSGQYAGLFKQAGFNVTTLIHETAETMRIVHWESLAQEAAMFSDNLVFPCDEVREGFNRIVASARGREFVQPQGVYLDAIVPNHFEGRAFLKELGIEDGDVLVLGSGTVEPRKGVDLFISAALALNTLWNANGNLGNCRLHVLWVGEGYGDYCGWLKCQLSKARNSENIHLVPFMDSSIYKAILERADIFWSTSRNDTFPSVVLEAMLSSVPVMAFSGAVGADSMLASGKGVLIENWSIEDFARQAFRILSGKFQTAQMVNKANEWVKNNLKFEDYVSKLLAISREEPLISPTFAERILSNQWGGEPGHNRPLQEQLPLKSISDSSAARNDNNRSITKQLIRRIVCDKSPVLLDPSLDTDNIGDEVIAESCVNACSSVFKVRELQRLPTHRYSEGLESLKGKLVIVCGTNLVYTHMERQVQWAFPRNLSNFDDLCFLGVGMQDLWIDEPFSDYSIELFRYLLNNGRVHSVRDEYTAERLREIGIENVVNTACPTMWKLTPGHCQQIPHSKASRCVATVTCHVPDAAADAFMLNTLRKEYDEVYIWLQGPYDYERCLRGVIDPTAFTILPPRLSELDRILSQDNIDYVGARLHAGIRALGHKKRSLIVSVDNRARHIAEGTGLPVMEREDLEEGLSRWINSSYQTEIVLPVEAIKQWKAQF